SYSRSCIGGGYLLLLLLLLLLLRLLLLLISYQIALDLLCILLYTNKHKNLITRPYWATSVGGHKMYHYHKPTRPIVIKPANRERLQAALTAAEGRATARRISAEYLIRLIEELEEQLKRYSTKRAMEGLTAKLAPHADRFPNAYKWRPEGTACDIEYNKGTWKLVSCYRDFCDTPADGSCILHMPEAMQAELVSRAHDLKL
ncbi:MAG TPA: hypothetical protein VFD34_02465, partial [Clostridia bacterium]|nr:hypothetical protein [Clostridia bacterium]